MIATRSSFESTLSVWDALGRYVSQLEASGRARNTLDQILRHVSLLGLWIDAQEMSDDVTQISPAEIFEFMCWPYVCTRADGEPKKASSMNTLRSSLRSFFGFLHEAGLIDQNPARQLKRAICSSAPPRGLSEREETKLLAALDEANTETELRDRMLILLMLRAGLRVGSAVAVHVEDLNLDEGELRLRQAKNSRLDSVVLGDSLVEELRSYVCRLGRDSGPLFLGGHGRPITTRQVSRRFTQWLRRADIERHLGPHCLRHSFGMAVYQRSRDILMVQRALCHSNISSSAVYARADSEALRRMLA